MFFEIKDLNVHYGAIHALKNVSLQVNEGEIVTLIGSNGAGKTSTLRTISGLVPKSSGTIEFMDKPIENTKATDIVKMGISHVPEGRRIFSDMTVLENLEMGAYLRNDKDGIKEDILDIYNKFPRLKERKSQLAGTLSGGEQQMLAISRALMSKPKFLLLDEPSMGLAPVIVQDIFKLIKQINEEGTTIFLVEQNANMALSISNRAYILETGEVVMSGNAGELLESDDVKKAYLGG
ncbi:ABC transporter ATP-binding protein [Anaerofustis stercorihominis]|uniref:ABC transporter, ATP-binding protein n=2 Tax=Anaerofustis stercorihominis TaxID=214853 RepID=B1CAQ7_9FIRM|nr:ABC transporter ATP-binding protein [Anaerofustis stercorihominis]EDS71354.1 ABC transporter, ATP-binding protein [Anaerofustis stercorihominis DSM 17244]MCQ4794751.1 ABC transporter ATP-binding protein [Anaerofustis stercorihominis]RGD73899.1 ABC transporter ATP-binding protein [Anaerofustis stercorihominis]